MKVPYDCTVLFTIRRRSGGGFIFHELCWYEESMNDELKERGFVDLVSCLFRQHFYNVCAIMPILSTTVTDQYVTAYFISSVFQATRPAVNAF